MFYSFYSIEENCYKTSADHDGEVDLLSSTMQINNSTIPELTSTHSDIHLINESCFLQNSSLMATEYTPVTFENCYSFSFLFLFLLLFTETEDKITVATSCEFEYFSETYGRSLASKAHNCKDVHIIFNLSPHNCNCHYHYLFTNYKYEFLSYPCNYVLLTLISLWKQHLVSRNVVHLQWCSYYDNYIEAFTIM